MNVWYIRVLLVLLKMYNSQASLCENLGGKWSAWFSGKKKLNCNQINKSTSNEYSFTEIYSYPVGIETNIAKNISYTAPNPLIELSTNGEWKCTINSTSKRTCLDYQRRVCCSKDAPNKPRTKWNEWIYMKQHSQDCNCGNTTYFAINYPGMACLNPVAITVRTLTSKVKHRYTSISPKILVSLKHGFKCDGSTGRSCSAYKIRFQCEITEETTEVSQTTSMTFSSPVSSFRSTNMTFKDLLGPTFKPSSAITVASKIGTNYRTDTTSETIHPTTSMSGSSSQFSTRIWNKSSSYNSTQSPKLFSTPVANELNTSLETSFLSSKNPLDIFLCLKQLLNSSDFNISLIDICIRKYVKYANDNITHAQDGIALSMVVTHAKFLRKSSKFNANSVDFVGIDSNYTNFSIVMLQFKLPRYFQQRLVSVHQSSSSDNLVISKIPLTDHPVLSISAFNRITYQQVSANISYTMNVASDLSIVNFAKSMQQNTSLFQKDKLLDTKYVCSFYNMTEQRYSDVGCTTTIINATEVACHCNHTTIFGVLLSVESYKVPGLVAVLSFVTELISIICLVFTFTILIIVRKKLSNNRIIIQINLTFALLCFHTANLFHEVASWSDATCIIIAITIHYFLLATATWMLVEGLNLFFITTRRVLSINSDEGNWWLKARIWIGWGIPAVIVFVSALAGLGTETYMNRIDSLDGFKMIKSCWLSPTTGTLLGAAIIPVAVIYSFNVVILCWVSMFVHKLRRESVRFQPSVKRNQPNQLKSLRTANVAATLKGVLMLLPALGVLWIFSFLSGLKNFEASIVFMYLNAILNGLQGLFLMLVYCVFGSEVRKTWTKINE